MKTISLFSIIIFVISNFSLLAQYETIDVDGLERTYLLHLPNDYDGNTDLPLVIAMHGGTGNAYNLQNQSQLSIKADEENFIVVYPEGLKGGNLNVRTWNAGWCCGYASNNNIDDVGFMDTLIDYLVENYSINSKRIYATGMSNGGYMSYRLACELSNKIATIAPVSAAMSMTSCESERPIPVIHFHSYQDLNVLYDGGYGDGLAGHYSPPLDSIFNVWSILNNCSNNETLIENDEYTFTQWNNCDCGAEIQYYITQDGGHSWHGGNGTLVGDAPSEFINANDLMWDFFQKYSLDCESITSTDNPNTTQKIRVYPNPSDGEFNIESSGKDIFFNVSVSNIVGEIVLRTINQKNIDISDFPSGVYFISISTKEGKVVQKVILE